MSHTLMVVRHRGRRPRVNRAPLPTGGSAGWTKARPRRAHRPRADDGETQAPKARRNVVLLRLRRPIREKPNISLPFATLVTKPGEKTGLMAGFVISSCLCVFVFATWVA